MACVTPCEQCNRKGLPILFTRYAAAYSARPEGMAALDKLKPTGQFQTKPGGVAMQTARYGLRMLRPGYLYLYIERRGFSDWEGYAIHPHGYLRKFEVMLPQTAEATVACERDARQANNSLIWVADAKNVRALWYMFHPDPILYEHLKREIEPDFAKYMQHFDVASWRGGSTNQPDAAEPAQLYQQVLEFAALSDTKVQSVGNEQCFGLMGSTPQERAWGSYEIVENDQQIIAVPDAAPVVIEAFRTITITQPAYMAKHGPRLEGIRKFLHDNKGAVVACDDALGVAQELSLHHLSAAIPYVNWLRVADVKGVSNAWKDSASRSIQTIKEALEAHVIGLYDDTTEHMRETQEIMGGHYPGSDSPEPVKLRRPDGTYEVISVQELNRRRRADLQTQIDAQQAKRGEAVKKANEKAVASITANCDLDAVKAFDGEHGGKVRERDTLMNQIAEDLLHWLKADSLTDRALGRYSEKASPETGDGARCAGQLCAILLQLDNSPRGRAWYGALDTFTPGKKNLVWRMLSLNNTEISQELQDALKLVVDPLPPPGQANTDAQDNARSQKAYTDMAAALSKMGKTLKSADKIEKDLNTVLDQSSKAADRVAAIKKISKEVKTNISAVLLSALMSQVKALSPSALESRMARGQALLLAQGLGTQAIAHIKQQQADALSAPLMKQAKSIQRWVDRAFRNGAANSAMQEMRTAHVICAVSALAVLPALGRAYMKRDVRATAELAGSVAALVGTLKQTRATFYEKALFKQVPDIVYKTHKAGTATVAERELLSLKAGAARYVAAGMVVGVVWDAADAVIANKEENAALRNAYVGRAIVGAATVFAAIRSARYLTVPMLLTRLNITTAIATVILTSAIGKLKGKAWVNWLQAQPFRKADSKKTPYESEEDMMDKLADGLAEID